MKIHNLLLMSVFSTVFMANAEQVADDKKPHSIKMKCHVELMGGGESIHYTFIKRSQLSQIKTLVAGREIPVFNSRKNKAIYKVNECLPMDKKFKNKRANMIAERLAQ
ncbi:TapY2 family type IVa secretion system protein [Thalassotalea sp. G2M2-11]|uniref:TapY2 family type IVa secretion system protein n=1 Tax=Thalassotalea sp. G2M2-11 TaxID=2787627 RepID=UPI0019D0DD52|nr:TapY2 family type IVa secretion system protein [Thalassotalea sp. G2M2-11]